MKSPGRPSPPISPQSNMLIWYSIMLWFCLVVVCKYDQNIICLCFGLIFSWIRLQICSIRRIRRGRRCFSRRVASRLGRLLGWVCSLFCPVDCRFRRAVLGLDLRWWCCIRWRIFGRWVWWGRGGREFLHWIFFRWWVRTVSWSSWWVIFNCIYWRWVARNCWCFFVSWRWWGVVRVCWVCCWCFCCRWVVFCLWYRWMVGWVLLVRIGTGRLVLKDLVVWLVHLYCSRVFLCIFWDLCCWVCRLSVVVFTYFEIFVGIVE